MKLITIDIKSDKQTVAQAIAQFLVELEAYKKGGTSYEKLAKEFDVSKGTIADIVKNRTWKSKEPVSTIP